MSLKSHYYTDYGWILAYRLIVSARPRSIKDFYSLYGELIVVLQREPIFSQDMIYL